MLGQARRRRGEEGTRVLVLVKLERERGANHLALVVARDSCPLHPAAPVVDRALEEVLGGLLQSGFERLAPGEEEVPITLEEKRALVFDVGEGQVGREADRCGKARVLDVVRGAPRARLDEAVVVARAAAHASARLSRERAQDADEHGRLEKAVVLLEPRRKVDELEGPARPVEHRTENVRVLDVLLPDVRRVDTLDREHPAALGVEQGAEDEARVRAWPAHPLHRPVAEQRAVRAVADDAETACHR